MNYYNHYPEQLYPLQDKFLHFFSRYNEKRFYLTGGTALSRFYFGHGFSDDLDFFSTREMPDFRSAVSQILEVSKKQNFIIETETISDHFFRVFLKENKTFLKIDFVNEVPVHLGDIKQFPLFDCVDNV